MTTNATAESSLAFSRFEINMREGRSLPVFPLLQPDQTGGLGAMLVGDYVANDFVDYHRSRDPDFNDKWLVVSTTQSDTVPEDVDRVDFNLFSNASGEDRYLQGKAGHVPYSLELADGLFVDPNVFHPPAVEEDPTYDILYMAKWFPTKKTEILLDTARKRRDIKVGLVGWLMASERKRAESETYRDSVLAVAAGIPNVTAYDTAELSTRESHLNPDGSDVLGPLTKEEVRDRFMHKSRTGIYLSETTEAVNRFDTEMLFCDRPLIVALPTYGGMERLMVESETSVFCERSAEGISEAYDTIVANRKQFTPRATMLKFAGKAAANATLHGIVTQMASTRGRSLSAETWNTYGGDLWTSPETYGIIE